MNTVFNTITNLPIFSDLNKRALLKLIELGDVVEYNKNEVIYKQLDDAENLYIVLSGTVSTSVDKDGAGKPIVLEYLYRGTCFGIISALTDSRHSVTAIAEKSTQVLLINKVFLKKFLERKPKFALRLSKLLSKRVASQAGIKKVFSNITISVSAEDESLGTSVFARNIAFAYKHETRNKKVLLIELRHDLDFYNKNRSNDKIFSVQTDNVDSWHDFIIKKSNHQCLRLCPDKNLSSNVIEALLSSLSHNFDCIVVDIHSSLKDYCYSLFKQSEYIFLLREEGATGGLKKDKQLNYDEFTDCVYNVEFSKKERARTQKQLFEPLRFRISPYASLAASNEFLSDLNTASITLLRDLVRKIAQVRVGIALGSGGSLALSHIGVLEVLEENNIDIDLVSASSMGALIGALWALGKTAEEIRLLLKREKNFAFFSLKEISLKGKSLLNGNTMHDVIKRILGNKTFADLKIPLYITAFDFLKREPFIFGNDKSVLLYKAVVASCSFPGIFPPLIHDKRKLFDGGILLPVPIDILIQKDIKRIIGSTVTPTAEDIAEMLATDDNKQLNAFDYIFGTIEAMQNQFIDSSLLSCDVILHPKLSNVSWTNFSKIDYCIEKGRVATQNGLFELRRL